MPIPTPRTRTTSAASAPSKLSPPPRPPKPVLSGKNLEKRLAQGNVILKLADRNYDLCFNFCTSISRCPLCCSYIAIFLHNNNVLNILENLEVSEQDHSSIISKLLEGDRNSVRSVYNRVNLK